MPSLVLASESNSLLMSHLSWVTMTFALMPSGKLRTKRNAKKFISRWYASWVPSVCTAKASVQILRRKIAWSNCWLWKTLRKLCDWLSTSSARSFLLRLLHGRWRRVLVLEEGAHQQRVLEAARADVSSACKLSHAVICVAAERSQVKSGQDRVC